MKQLFTIGEVLELIEEQYHNPKALVTFKNGIWQAISTEEFISQVKYAAFALQKLGIKKGDKVGIIALPSAEWTIVDYAIMASGAISVPLFANISEENFRFEVEQTGLKTVFVGGLEQWERSEKDSDLFDHIIGLEAHHENPKEIAYSHFLEMGKEHEKTLEKDAFHKMLQTIKPSDIATIIYTSGSTGIPKGAVHTHHSLASLLNTPIFNWDSEKDTYLNFLPVAHVFARVLNLIMTTWGISCYYYNDIKNLPPAFAEVKPSVMVVVPRLLEKMYSKMTAKVDSSSGIKKMIGTLAFKIANAKTPSLFQRLMKPLMDKLVYSTLRNALGGNLRIVFCGGAPLNPRLYHFFLNAGFPIYEGWGLTEACPICVNRPGNIKIGSVGLPVDGMHVKLGGDGELLTRGEMMMSSYYKNESETKKTIDSDGWLHTGDKGSIDESGHVTIIGRLKELYKSSTGEWIAPVPIEQALAKASFIESAMVVAENRKFASVLIIPEFEVLHQMKEKQNAEALTDEEFLNSAYMRSEIKKILNSVNQTLDEWSQIKDFRFIPSPLSIEAGELTPSLKIKREAVANKYKTLIDSIYEKENP